MRNGFALFQLWFVGTAVWMIGWVIMINSSCAPGAGDLLVCSPAFLQRLASVVSDASVTFAQLVLCGLAVPVAVLVAGGLLYRLSGAGRSG